MSKVEHGCYIETAGLDEDTIKKIEAVFVAKFGMSSSKLIKKKDGFTKLFAGEEGNGCYYETLVVRPEYPVTVEDVLGSIKEEEEVTHFKAMKFRVDNEEHSRQIQEALFELGYSWCTGSKEVKYTLYKFLFTSEQGSIKFSDDEEYFCGIDYLECYIEPVTKFEIKEVQVPVKKMTKEEIEEALGYKVEIVD